MRRDLIALPEDSKVWVYQANKALSDEISQLIKADLYDFSMSWSSHGKELDSYSHLFHYQFVVMVADGSNLPSGCSIDSSVHFLEALGKKYEVDFFDRMTFAYMVDDHVKFVKSSEFPDYYSSNKITDETLMFDNLVDSKSKFIEGWIKPLKDSWHTKFI